MRLTSLDADCRGSTTTADTSTFAWGAGPALACARFRSGQPLSLPLEDIVCSRGVAGATRPGLASWPGAQMAFAVTGFDITQLDMKAQLRTCRLPTLLEGAAVRADGHVQLRPLPLAQ